MIIVAKRRSVKIRIDGPDANGKVTCRSILVSDANVDEVKDVIIRAIYEKTKAELERGEIK